MKTKLFMAWSSYHSNRATEEYLYKFLSKRNLERFLETGSVWFSRADIFGDKMECVSIADLLEDRPDYNKIETRKKRFLISCWHLADRESLALWDTYSETVENRRTTAIRFKRTDLIRLVKEYSIRNHMQHFYKTEFIHGKISYKTLIGVDLPRLLDQTVKELAFRKEEAFKYENEYRFVIRQPHPFEYDGYSYTIDKAQNLPFNIIINPLLNRDQYLPIKKQIEELGFSDKLVASDLAQWLHPELW